MVKITRLRLKYLSFMLAETEVTSLRCRVSLLKETVLTNTGRKAKPKTSVGVLISSLCYQCNKLRQGFSLDYLSVGCKLPSCGLQVPSVHPYLIKAPSANCPKSATWQPSMMFKSPF